jgi:hypothetical protein
MHGSGQSDIRDIPVIINNRNRLTYLMQLVKWCEEAGFRRIIILDNLSDYPPLLNYYESCPHQVIRLGANVGPRAVWQSAATKDIIRHYYIYSDADVLPDSECDLNTIAEMKWELGNNVFLEKVGLGLHIDDLPDHFRLKDEVIKWESQFWNKPVERGFYAAPVDTTFAIYAPYAQGGGECRALRTGNGRLARHLPWYENSADPGEESLYYIQHAAPLASHWTELTK